MQMFAVFLEKLCESIEWTDRKMQDINITCIETSELSTISFLQPNLLFLQSRRFRKTCRHLMFMFKYLSGQGTPLWHHYTVDFILFKSGRIKARACSELDEKIKSALLCSFNHAEGCSIATGSESQDEGSQFPPCRFTAQLLGALRIQLPQQHKLR